MPPTPQRIAVVDLGTNSTRLLIAEIDADGVLHRLETRTEVTRLGEGVDASGRLSNTALERVHACLSRYRQLVDEHIVERVIAVATSAVRDADNGSDFQRQICDRYGFETRVISGDEEARLTFLGATTGRGPGPTLVIDIGGGSTEFVVGEPGFTPAFHVSTRLGSVRQTERHLTDDPPDHHQLSEAANAARRIVVDQVPADVRDAVTQGIAVAGTATSLAAIDQELDPYEPDRVDGYELDLEGCERMLAMLAARPVGERHQIAGLEPKRAPTIVAGAAILVEALHVFGLESLVASEADILHGAALRAAQDA